MTSDGGPCQDRSDIVGPRIVFGVDESAASTRALSWGAAEAELRGPAPQVVHVDFARRQALDALAPGKLSAEQSVLDRAVVRAQALAPSILVTGRLCDPPAGKALIAAEGAEMPEVGSRGLSGLKELALGSVSSECARHGLCPIVIIRPPARQQAAHPDKAVAGVSEHEGRLAKHRCVGRARPALAAAASASGIGQPVGARYKP